MPSMRGIRGIHECLDRFRSGAAKAFCSEDRFVDRFEDRFANRFANRFEDRL